MLGTCFIGAIPSFDTNSKISNNVNSDQTPDLRLLSASFLCTFELLRDKSKRVTMIPSTTNYRTAIDLIKYEQLRL